METLAETLKASNVHLKNLVSDEVRCAQMTASAEGIIMDYSKQLITQETMDALFELAEAANLSGKMQAMVAGQHINNTEDRSVLHFALRAPESAVVHSDGKNVIPDVHAVLKQIDTFSTKVRNGVWKGCTGRNIKNIISVGIGGSYLGPEFVYESLRNDATASAQASGRTLRFLANVDPIDVSRAISHLDPEETLVCIVSKTFTTAETMMNARTIVQWLVGHYKKKGSPVTRESIIRQHMVAIR